MSIVLKIPSYKMSLEELVNNYEVDLKTALGDNDPAERDLLVLDTFREFKNNLMKLDAFKGEFLDNKAPQVELGTFSYAESRYVRGDKGWLAASLYKEAKDEGLEPFDMPLAGFDLSMLPFKVQNLDSFIWHMHRCMLCNTEIPVLLDDLGQVADGNHRIARAILDGKRTIKAYRLKYMPPVDFMKEEE